MLGFEVLGHGENKVVIMHDWLGSHKNYQYLWNFLDTDKYQYAFVDLRGYGLSKDLVGEYTTEEAADDVFDVVNQLEWDKFHLVGHSMSGQIGLRMLSIDSSSIKSFIGIAPVPATSTRMPKEVLSGIKKLIESHDGRRKLLVDMMNKNLNHKWLDFKLDHWESEAEIGAIKGYLHMFATEDFSDKLKKITKPTLIIGCHEDMEGFKPFDLRRAFEGLGSRVKFKDITDSGHYPMQETPALLASIMDGFWCEVA